MWGVHLPELLQALYMGVAFMLSENEKLPNRHKLSELNDCFLDFILSRKAMLCTPSTIRFYRFSLDKLIEFLDSEGVMKPTQITAKHIRAFLSDYAERWCKDSYIHTFARSSRIFILFLLQEGYIQKEISFQMPQVGEKHRPVLSIAEVTSNLVSGE
jgi:site-specific recombinase XerD